VKKPIVELLLVKLSIFASIFIIDNQTYFMKITRITMVFAFAMLFIGSVHAQTEQELYKIGLKYKKQINNPKMLETFKKLCAMDSTNVDYMSNLSFAYSKVGANLSEESKQLKYYAKAKKIAGKAKKANDKHAFAHYAYALALARENENAKTKVKIINAKEIKKECDRALALDPTLAGAYHIMARWHRTFAGFSNFEKAMVNTFYGGVPKGGSYKDALEMFQKAIKLEPWYMLHTYELAVTYHEMGKDDYAKKFVEKAMTLPQKYEDAKLCYKKCEKLKAELK